MAEFGLHINGEAIVPISQSNTLGLAPPTIGHTPVRPIKQPGSSSSSSSAAAKAESTTTTSNPPGFRNSGNSGNSKSHSTELNVSNISGGVLGAAMDAKGQNVGKSLNFVFILLLAVVVAVVIFVFDVLMFRRRKFS